MKILESESSRQKQELQELQARLFQEERKEEEARREAFSLRQKVLECEAGRDAALNEVEKTPGVCHGRNFDHSVRRDSVRVVLIPVTLLCPMSCDPYLIFALAGRSSSVSSVRNRVQGAAESGAAAGERGFPAAERTTT